MEAPIQDPKLELLQRVPLFAGMAPDTLEALGGIVEERDVPAGTAVTATAESPCHLLVLTFQRFQQLLDTAPEVRTAIFEEVGRRFRELDAESAH